MDSFHAHGSETPGAAPQAYASAQKASEQDTNVLRATLEPGRVDHFTQGMKDEYDRVRAGFAHATATGNAPTSPTSSASGSDMGANVQAFKDGAAEEAQRIQDRI